MLKDTTLSEGRYKLALICMKMKKYPEAEKALISKFANDPNNIQAIGGAGGYYLLGCIAERQARIKDAIKFYYKAIDLNPTLWVVFEKLCRLDSRLKSDSVFKDLHNVISGINTLITRKDYFNKTGQSLNSHIQNYKSRNVYLNYLASQLSKD